MDHPSDSKREWLTGIVTRVYPDTWEVDARLIVNGAAVVKRCKVHGVYLPEVHNTDPDGNPVNDRQSKVLVGWVDAFSQSPVAVPVHNTMIPDDQKARHVYWSEHLRFRTTIDRSGNLEIRNLKGDQLLQVRIQEIDGVVRLDTPSTRIVQRESDASIEVHCDGDLTATCANADITAEGDVTVHATTLHVHAKTVFHGDVDITGKLDMVVGG